MSEIVPLAVFAILLGLMFWEMARRIRHPKPGRGDKVPNAVAVRDQVPEDDEKSGVDLPPPSASFPRIDRGPGDPSGGPGDPSGGYGAPGSW